MAIDISIPDHRQRLSKAIRKSYTDAAPNRVIRRNLLDIYRDKANPAFDSATNDSKDLGTLLNLFQKFVRGHILTLAYYAPRWQVDARVAAGRGLDKRMQSFMNRYTEVLNFNATQRKLALDSAFGWAVCKVTEGIAPKGITAPVAPRAYRINPDMLIVDPTAADVDECSYIGDIYLVPLNEAQAHEGFDRERASKLQEYRETSDGNSFLSSEVESYAEPMTRLIDVYIAKAGAIYTWPAPNDNFDHISADEPLGERESVINPYAMLNLTEMPNNLVEIARLRSLRGLHLVSNEMLNKGVEQARSSQRNPFGPLGSEQDMATALNAGDNNPFFVENKENLGLFNIPGPDASILNLGSAAAKLFSSEAGNLEVALGASAGADTARQTEALLGQISASQSLDRRAFEEFLGEIGKKLMTLAFHNESLELETMESVPGTKIQFSRMWAGPKKMPRAVGIDAMGFEVVPYSTAFRTPQEKVAQLNQASQLVLQWMTAKAQGAPIALEAVINDIAEGFDLMLKLPEWWNGQEPTPAEKTGNTYQSMAQPAQGSDIRYQGSQQQQSDAQDSPQQGGVS